MPAGTVVGCSLLYRLSCSSRQKGSRQSLPVSAECEFRRWVRLVCTVSFSAVYEVDAAWRVIDEVVELQV